VANVPTGIGSIAIRRTMADLRALGEIMNVPPPQLDPILERAEKELREQPGNSGQGQPPTP